jgi:hypothetical protein
LVTLPTGVKYRIRDSLLIQYDKPDWYYYMFNLMKKDSDDKVVVDHAQVDHPATIGGVLDKVK